MTIQIRMGGYGPATTGFSRALKLIGDRLTARFGDRVDIKYVWNIMDLGYRAEDILWLVEHGLLTLGYQSSSYLTDRVPELGIVDLPFLFSRTQSARAAMDGTLGDVLARKIEERVNFRVLGWFENGFRHISNRLREVRAPAHLVGQRIRVLPSKEQARTFELLGSVPSPMDLPQAIAMITAGTIDAQENPLSNTVTYGAPCKGLLRAQLPISAICTSRRKRRRAGPSRHRVARSSSSPPPSAMRSPVPSRRSSM